jgi:hypothetical protein
MFLFYLCFSLFRNGHIPNSFTYGMQVHLFYMVSVSIYWLEANSLFTIKKSYSKFHIFP